MKYKIPKLLLLKSSRNVLDISETCFDRCIWDTDQEDVRDLKQVWDVVMLHPVLAGAGRWKQKVVLPGSDMSGSLRDSRLNQSHFLLEQI